MRKLNISESHIKRLVAGKFSPISSSGNKLSLKSFSPRRLSNTKITKIKSSNSNKSSEIKKVKSQEIDKASWNDDLRYIFIRSILKNQEKSYSDNGFTKAVWAKISYDFREESKTSYSKQQLQSQLNEMKSNYQIFSNLKNNSGFGWDDANSIPTAPQQVWDAYLNNHKKAAKYRYKTLPFFDDMHSIFDGNLATGKYAAVAPVISAVTTAGAVSSKKRSRASSESDDSEDDDIINVDVDDKNKGKGEIPKNDNKPQRKLSMAQQHEQTNKLLSKLIDNHQTKSNKESYLTQAMTIVKAKFSDKYSVIVTIKISLSFSANPNDAEVFVTLNREQQQVFLNFLLGIEVQESV